MNTNQELRQASVRAVTGTAYTYNGDWMALFDMEGIAAGPFNQRFLAWINARLSSAYTELNGAKAAFAAAEGVDRFADIGVFVATSGPDVTAPILSSPSDTATTSGTTGSGFVYTNEADGTLYWVVSTSATAPSKAQVKAGQTHTGAAATDSGSQAVTMLGVQPISGGFTGLTSETTYYAHYMHEDSDGNQSDVSSADGFTTPDVTAPVLSSPVDTATGDTTGEGTVSTTEDNGTLYYVVSYYLTAPSAAQIIAGLEYNGDAAPLAGSQAVTTTGTQTVTFEGLSGATLYYAYFVHVDSVANISNVASGDGFTPGATALIGTPLGSYYPYTYGTGTIVSGGGSDPDDTLLLLL